MTNHKSQTNYKKTMNKKTNIKTFRVFRVFRGPVFVLNFEPLSFEFVCNLWFVICDFPASRTFLVPARPGRVYKKIPGRSF